MSRKWDREYCIFAIQQFAMAMVGLVGFIFIIATYFAYIFALGFAI